MACYRIIPKATWCTATAPTVLKPRSFHRKKLLLSKVLQKPRHAQTSQLAVASHRPPLIQRSLTKLMDFPAIPIGSFVSKPTSVLHRLDPRVKQAWLAALLLLSPNGTCEEKVLVCGCLTSVTAVTLPSRVWRPQLSALLGMGILLFTILLISADSIIPLMQSREPHCSLEGLELLPELEQSFGHVLLSLGPIQITRRALNLAVSSSCLTFTVLQSASLILYTTTPENMALGLRWYLQPLLLLKAPIDEITFTLLVSLRFTTIVFEELRNISVGLAARGIDWEAMGFRGSLSMFGSLLSRALDSLLHSSELVSDALLSRGYARASQVDVHAPNGNLKLDQLSNLCALVALCIFIMVFESN
jgi:energy-coupling factor transporter transmembrane protein EcfT|mmetsp:Transcript_9911/g.27602  ORF Transcript_9911/g.27602 Transcript_9911/m.27602 type:complete len:360 (+) Transcript_9911:31-1110(+)